MLIVFGDNSDRVHSEADLANLCYACPIPAQSGAHGASGLGRA
jgi:hypothetical protein